MDLGGSDGTFALTAMTRGDDALLDAPPAPRAGGVAGLAGCGGAAAATLAGDGEPAEVVEPTDGDKGGVADDSSVMRGFTDPALAVPVVALADVALAGPVKSLDEGADDDNNDVDDDDEFNDVDDFNDFNDDDDDDDGDDDDAVRGRMTAAALRLMASARTAASLLPGSTRSTSANPLAASARRPCPSSAAARRKRALGLPGSSARAAEQSATQPAQ
jgi:hypothetical protein